MKKRRTKQIDNHQVHVSYLSIDIMLHFSTEYVHAGTN